MPAAKQVSTYVISSNEQPYTKRPPSIPLSLNLWLWSYQLSHVTFNISGNNTQLKNTCDQKLAADNKQERNQIIKKT